MPPVYTHNTNLEETKVKEKLLLVMPLTLGMMLLVLTIVSFNSLIEDVPSVESSYTANYNSQPDSICEVSHVIDSMATPNLSLNLDNIHNATLSRMNTEVLAASYIEDEPELVTVESISMRNADGVWEQTNELQVDVDKLVCAYRDEYIQPDWDDKNKVNIIATLWEFLVNQQNMDPVNAAALLGNIMAEGSFTQEQGTHTLIQDIEVLRAVLGKGNRGYGIAQWTYSSRQKALLEYYEVAYDMYPDDWDKVKIVAECAMLLEEVKAYRVFDDISLSTSLEDATGRVCVIYEGYSNSTSEWGKVNGQYTLRNKNGSGSNRLAYAKAIYDYFTE